MESSLSNKENTCVVCFRNIDIYSIGNCDHYDRVCYVCSARLRTLCQKYDCPICRKELPEVIFSQHKIPYSVLSKSRYPTDSKHKISFHNETVENKYWELLQQECSVCPSVMVFNSFGQLKDHLRKEHELFFCDLCVEHLKLFTSERKCYNRKELAQHRRVGDPDNTSHKGHPRCQFCDQRYLDKDELYRHLRRYHFFCHFCEADGKYEFYGDYNFLRKHFQECHFLCEEDTCINEQFTSVFKSDIDLIAHISAKHSKGLSKQQAKQARTLELEFTIVPREYNGGIQPNTNYDRNSRRGGKNMRRGMSSRDSRSYGDRQYEDSATNDLTSTSYYPEPEQEINTTDEKEFPTLSNRNGEHPPGSTGKKITITTSVPRNYRRTFSVTNEEDFPSLSKQGSSNLGGSSSSSKVTVSSQSNAPSTLTLRFDNKDNSSNKAQTQNVSIKFSSKANNVTNVVDNGNENWGTAAKFVPTKNLEEDFPSLVTKKGRDNCTSTMTIPVNTAWGKKSKNDERKHPEDFEVVKTKAQKKKQKNALVVLSGSKIKDDKSNSNSSTENINFNFDREIPGDYNGFSVLANKNAEEILEKSEVVKPRPVIKPAKLKEADFPPLSAPAEKPSAPPGFKTPKITETKREPPPGYTTSGPPKQSSVSISLSSLAKQLSVNPKEPLSHNLPMKAIYATPENYEERNKKLIYDILEILGDDEDSFNEFKQFSKLFRQSELCAAEYYSKCSLVFGKERFMRVLAELLVLLPDINKQQELLTIHNEACKKESRNVGTVPKNLLFMVCATCQQVLSNGDFRDHMQSQHPEPDVQSPSSDQLATMQMKWTQK